MPFQGLLLSNVLVVVVYCARGMVQFEVLADHEEHMEMIFPKLRFQNRQGPSQSMEAFHVERQMDEP